MKKPAARRIKKAGGKKDRERARVTRELLSGILEGPTQTIAASVPKRLIDQVRGRVNKREFSRFVARSMANELVRLNREQFVSEVVEHTGPLDKESVTKARRLLRQ